MSVYAFEVFKLARYVFGKMFCLCFDMASVFCIIFRFLD